MTLLPRSLLWRTFLLLALLVVVATGAWFQIFRAYEAAPRARVIAQNLVSTINLTRAALVNAQPERRRQLLEDLSEREGLEIYPSEPGERIVPPPDREMVRLVAEAVRERLGAQTRFASRREGRPGFWVSFHIDEDEYWVRVPRERIERAIALQWLYWGALALVLSLVAAYFIVSRVSRPLKRLAEAATAIGHGKKPEPVPETGPSEIRTLSRSFNDMSR
ncbi:MAG TPA: HAMP domain-containing protein, partial [Burkholderiales bacterium]